MSDWRADNASHLRGFKLHRRRYTKWSGDWDHDHCAGCSAKFAESDGADILHEGWTIGEGYPKGADYEWVCLECFAALNGEMGRSQGP